LLETPHVIVAAAIAYKVGNPALALPLALGSHFVLEKVPHWNPHLNQEKQKYGHLTLQTKKIIFVDSFIALFIGALVAIAVLPNTMHFLYIILACLLSVLPDVLEAPYFFMDHQNVFTMKLHKFQKSIQSDTTAIPGLTFQAATILAAFLWILQ
jgi:hypothetical protein